MRWLLTSLLVLLLAVAVTLFAKGTTGYLMLVYPPYRIEVSLPFAILATLFGFVAAYAVVRLVLHTLRLPERVRAHRLHRARNRARNAMDQALNAYFEGHFRRAERFAALALKSQEVPSLAPILAARAAHEQHDPAMRDSYLKTADTLEPQSNLLKLATQAEFLLDEGRAAEALAVVKSALEAFPRHVSLLKLEVKAHTLAKNWDLVLDRVGELAKLKGVDRRQLEPLRLSAVKESIRMKAHDSAVLQDYWRKLSAVDRLDPGVASAAAEAFSKHGMGEEACSTIERVLDKQWDAQLVELYGEVSGVEPLRQIQRAEAWLAPHPHDATLLLALGKLCMRERLWGKAQNYVEASLSIEDSRTAHATYAQLMQKMGKPEAALTYNRKRQVA